MKIRVQESNDNTFDVYVDEQFKFYAEVETEEVREPCISGGYPDPEWSEAIVEVVDYITFMDDDYEEIAVEDVELEEKVKEAINEVLIWK